MHWKAMDGGNDGISPLSRPPHYGLVVAGRLERRNLAVMRVLADEHLLPHFQRVVESLPQAEGDDLVPFPVHDEHGKTGIVEPVGGAERARCAEAERDRSIEGVAELAQRWERILHDHR